MIKARRREFQNQKLKIASLTKEGKTEDRNISRKKGRRVTPREGEKIASGASNQQQSRKKGPQGEKSLREGGQ